MDYTTYLVHHGIKGMKWGVRRYQNKDGSLTAAGRKRYLKTDGSFSEAGKKWYQNPDGSITRAGQNYMYYGESFLQSVLEGRNAFSREKKALENYVKNEQFNLLLNKPESWAKAQKLQKRYNELLQTELKKLRLDKTYDAGAIINQYYDQEVTTFLQVQNKDNPDKTASPNFDGGLWRWFGGEKADDFYKREYVGDETVPYGYAYMMAESFDERDKIREKMDQNRARYERDHKR